jgi:glucokinase
VPSGRSSRSAVSNDVTIGVDLGGTKLALAAVGPTGRVLSSHRHPTELRGGAEPVVRDITDCIDGCLGPAGRRASRIGIGIAAQVDGRGTVVTSPNLGWTNVPLRILVERATRRPTMVTNDVRAITYGEWKHGAGRGAQDLVCIFVGTGIGGGIVADGRLRYGASNTAGEVGHMTIVSGGRKCHCPNSGCLEAYAGGWAIAERAQERARQDPKAGAVVVRKAHGVDRVTAKTVSEASRAGDRFARELMAETAEYLAAGLVGVVNGFNPGVVVLGGGVIEGVPSLVPATARRVRAMGLRVATRRLKVVRAGLGGRAGVLGAAAMARDGVPGGR